MITFKRIIKQQESWVEKYRPKIFEELVGQENPVRILRKFSSAPYSCAFLFTGETGVGKTSAALVLSLALGCTLDPMGGLLELASGEQTGDSVRDCLRQMMYVPLNDKGWSVLVVNEADRMTPSAESVWLDALEQIGKKNVIIFSTNKADSLSDRFKDRCMVIQFSTIPNEKIIASLQHISEQEGLSLSVKELSAILDDSTDPFQGMRESKGVSLRKAIQFLQRKSLEK